MCVILAVVRLLQGHGWLDALLSAVTLAAAAIPEEFPVVFTFFLGVGVYRLARRQALVRRAVAVENIGRVTCICSDKTGTITEGRLRLTHLVAAESVSDAELLALGRAGVAARQRRSAWTRPSCARPTPPRTGTDGREALATFPFTEGRRRETAIVRDAGSGVRRRHEGRRGDGPRDVGCSRPPNARGGMTASRAWPRTGHKVIACAWRPVDEPAGAGDEPEHGYRLAGLLAFEDPVRDGVAEAVGACRRRRHPRDHGHRRPPADGARGRPRGRPRRPGRRRRDLTGEAMEALVARGEGRALREVDVIARATPAQKLALVRALQAAGEIVAVTGDGVNDVPALQAADIGIAMGERGTRSAREVAAIVLLDDNFRTIVGAIAEGRQLFRNLRAASRTC